MVQTLALALLAIVVLRHTSAVTGNDDVIIDVKAGLLLQTSSNRANLVFTEVEGGEPVLAEVKEQLRSVVELASSNFSVTLSLEHVIEGALKSDGCMFSFVEVTPRNSGDNALGSAQLAAYAGAYRRGTCMQEGDTLVGFRADDLEHASSPSNVAWRWEEAMGLGEDPRCFLWGHHPTCLFWEQMHGPFKILIMGKSTRTITLDTQVTKSIGGKNWIPVPALNGTLYLVVSVQPLKVLRYDGEERGSNVGLLSQHYWEDADSDFEFRGGTPAQFISNGCFNGYVALGRKSFSYSDHKVVAYMFDADLRRVEVSDSSDFLIPSASRDEPLGVWDPLSIWYSSPASGGQPALKAVVSYWNDAAHSRQNTNIFQLRVQGTAVCDGASALLASR